jgi:hypothetical protein
LGSSLINYNHANDDDEILGIANQPNSQHKTIINGEGNNPLVPDNISNDNISKFSELLKESLEKSKTKMNDKQLKKIFDL